jgi:sporulation protein YabP
MFQESRGRGTMAQDTDYGEGGRHELHLTDRSQLSLTGVRKVESFDHQEVVLVTSRGTLRVQGENLHIRGLDLERGTCGVEGSIEALTYRESHRGDGRGGRLFSRLVR